MRKREAFCSKPEISSYLSLIEVAEQSGQREEEVNAAIAWTIALLNKEKDNEVISFTDYEEKTKSSASQYLLTQMHMVNGNHQKVFRGV